MKRTLVNSLKFETFSTLVFPLFDQEMDITNKKNNRVTVHEQTLIKQYIYDFAVIWRNTVSWKLNVLEYWVETTTMMESYWWQQTQPPTVTVIKLMTSNFDHSSNHHSSHGGCTTPTTLLASWFVAVDFDAAK